MTEIKTSFRDLSFDFLKQLILRAEEKTDNRIEALWVDMSLIGGVVKNLVYAIDPVGERELIAMGYIGLLELEEGRGTASPRIMVKPTVKDTEVFQLLWDTNRVDARQIVGVSEEGAILFTATHADNYTPPPRTLPDRICFTQNFKKLEQANGGYSNNNI